MLYIFPNGIIYAENIFIIGIYKAKIFFLDRFS